MMRAILIALTGIFLGGVLGICVGTVLTNMARNCGVQEFNYDHVLQLYNVCFVIGLIVGLVIACEYLQRTEKKNHEDSTH